MPVVEPERFDDVAFRVVEHPDPPRRPPRIRRGVLAVSYTHLTLPTNREV